MRNYYYGGDNLHLILGGRYMGKEDYARKIYGTFAETYNLAHEAPENITSPGLITELHMGVKSLISRNINAPEFFARRLEVLRPSVIIGDEISCGVVPVDEFSRQWRTETGQVYQLLAREADIVDRIFAGLSLRLKG